MRIEQLKYFICLYEEKSISKAADRLFISQPALSISLADLEEKLGVRLFERSWKGLEPTSYAEQIIVPVREILRNLDIIQNCVSKTDTTSEIHILTLSVFATKFLPNVVHYFGKKYEDVNIYIEEKSYADIIDSALEHYQRGESVISICLIEDDIKETVIKRLSELQVETVFLGTDTSYCYAGKSIFPQKETLTIEECYNQPVLQCKAPTEGLQSELRAKNEILEKVYITGNRQISVSSMEMLKQMICDNLGITILPGLFLYDDERKKNGDIHVMKIDGVSDLLAQNYYILYPKKELKEHEKFLIKLIQDEFASFEQEFM